MIAKPVLITLLTAAAVWIADPGILVSDKGGERVAPVLTLGASEAKAQRGQARRTARRTTRRVVRRTSVAGCTPYRAYYNCGGVYYAPVQEGGTTVYVVVNP